MIRILLALSLVVGTFTAPLPAQMAAAPAASASALPTGVLTREQAGPLVPSTVFYHGQVATTQARNSAGIKLANGKVVLFALVDTSGYSTAEQQVYQAYLITETTLRLGDTTLPPGAYGFGFVAGDRMVVMDLGANQLVSVPTTHDAALKRPVPLQLLANGPNSYKLCLGRSVAVVRVEEK